MGHGTWDNGTKCTLLYFPRKSSSTSEAAKPSGMVFTLTLNAFVGTSFLTLADVE